ncbi:MAG: class I SAM-dependent methyltransferase [Myxococcota bacterium]
MRRRWNANIHYHPWVLDAVRCAGGPVLDFGCGEGQLARTLARGGAHRVVGIDRHARSIELAREAAGDVEYVMGDFLAFPFEPESFGAIVSVAALHHVDFAEALDRARLILRPGGVFAAVGLARSDWSDVPRDVAAWVIRTWLGRGKGWKHPSPIRWPPPLTYGQVRDRARRQLPGSEYRRRTLARYSIRWTKPIADRR